MPFLFLGLFLSLSAAAGAPLSYTPKAECSRVDLRPKLPPVRNQDSIGWCYAFVAADLLSFETGTAVSGTDVAVQYNHQWWDDVADSWKTALGIPTKKETERRAGTTKSALEKVLARGACREEHFRSIDFSYSERLADMKSNLVALEEIARKVEGGSLHAGELACTHFPQFQFVFPGLQFQEVWDILARSDEKNLIRELSEVACKNRIRFEPQPVRRSYLNLGLEIGNRGIAKKIQAVLDKGKPVAIGYDQKVLFQSTHVPGSATHSSVLAGRRWNAGKSRCELLVRNAYGSTCYYDKDYECEKGNIWVPEGIIARAISDIDYFE